MAAIKCTIAKRGRILMANDRIARKFTTKGKALSFIRNLVRVSNDLTIKDFEIIPL